LGHYDLRKNHLGNHHSHCHLGQHHGFAANYDGSSKNWQEFESHIMSFVLDGNLFTIIFSRYHLASHVPRVLRVGWQRTIGAKRLPSKTL
jgi:hypothetical protein